MRSSSHGVHPAGARHLHPRPSNTRDNVERLFRGHATPVARRARRYFSHMFHNFVFLYFYIAVPPIGTCSRARCPHMHFPFMYFIILCYVLCTRNTCPTPSCYCSSSIATALSYIEERHAAALAVAFYLAGVCGNSILFQTSEPCVGSLCTASPKCSMLRTTCVLPRAHDPRLFQSLRMRGKLRSIVFTLLSSCLCTSTGPCPALFRCFASLLHDRAFRGRLILFHAILFWALPAHIHPSGRLIPINVDFLVCIFFFYFFLCMCSYTPISCSLSVQLGGDL